MHQKTTSSNEIKNIRIQFCLSIIFLYMKPKNCFRTTEDEV